MGARQTLMQTEYNGRIQLHIGDAENPPGCAKGEVRRLVGHDSRAEVVEGVARAANSARPFGSERLCARCFTAAERRDFVRISATLPR